MRAEEAGIAKHIRAVHGKDAFGSETVKDSFDMHPELDHPGAKDAMRGDTTARN